MLLFLDMLNYHGFGRHLCPSERCVLYAQPIANAICLSTIIMSVSGRLARILSVILLCWVALYEGVDLFARFALDLHISSDLILVLYGSSPKELTQFIGVCYGWKMMVLLMTLLPAFVVVVVFACKMSFPLRRMIALRVTLIIVCAACVYWMGTLGRPRGYLLCTSFFRNVLANVLVISDQIDVAKHPDPNVEFRIARDTPPVGVIVIGESSTRSHWGLYGYSRDTTPNISSISNDLFVFSNLLGVHNNTQPSLRKMLTLATVEKPDRGRCSLPWVLMRAGYDVELVSSQAKWGRGENMTTMLFSCCPKRFYLADILPRGYYDESVLPYVDEVVARSLHGHASMLFIHLQGSHAPFDEMYPAARCAFCPAYVDSVTKNMDEHKRRWVNSYDSSIHYTDYVLSQIICRLEKIERPAFLLYVSDHGETPMRGLMRIESDPDLWELPMFVWLSKSYRLAELDLVRKLNCARDRALQLDQLFHGLLEMAFVVADDEAFDERLSFLSDEFKPRRRRMCVGINGVYQEN